MLGLEGDIALSHRSWSTLPAFNMVSKWAVLVDGLSSNIVPISSLERERPRKPGIRTLIFNTDPLSAPVLFRVPALISSFCPLLELAVVIGDALGLLDRLLHSRRLG